MQCVTTGSLGFRGLGFRIWGSTYKSTVPSFATAVVIIHIIKVRGLEVQSSRSDVADSSVRSE